jgi:hypothetical protein
MPQCLGHAVPGLGQPIEQRLLEWRRRQGFPCANRAKHAAGRRDWSVAERGITSDQGMSLVQRHAFDEQRAKQDAEKLGLIRIRGLTDRGHQPLDGGIAHRDDFRTG